MYTTPKMLTKCEETINKRINSMFTNHLNEMISYAEEHDFKSLRAERDCLLTMVDMEWCYFNLDVEDYDKVCGVICRAMLNIWTENN